MTEVIVIKLINDEYIIGQLDADEELDGEIKLVNPLRIEIAYTEQSNKPAVIFYPWNEVSADSFMYCCNYNILYHTAPTDKVLHFYNQYFKIKPDVPSMESKEFPGNASEVIQAMLELHGGNTTIN